MNTGALIISVGSKANQSSLDPLQMVGSISVVQRLVMTFHLAEVKTIVIVASAQDRQKIEKYTKQTEVVIIDSPGEETEMLDNVKLGLSYLQEHCTQVLITPVDIPLFSVDTVKTLIQSNCDLASPVCEEKTGHPLLIGSNLIPAILQYDGDNGLRGAIRNCGFERRYIEVPDPGVYVKSDQFEECENMIPTHNQKQWRPIMKLQIAKETSFLGPGSWQLLSLIESTGSVRIASQKMGISYSKAWKILNNLEEQMGYFILVRKPGGKSGGETHLTEQGKEMLEWFEGLERECNKAIHDIFIRHYEKLQS